MPKIDIAALESDASTAYPEPIRKIVLGRSRKRLGNAVGLDQFGVNLSTLTPGAASSQRHWHANEDEFVYMLAGELVLCEDGGETVLRPGDAAGWKAGVANGHCLVNRGTVDAVYLEIGTRAPRELVDYPDIDMRMEREGRTGRYVPQVGRALSGVGAVNVACPRSATRAPGLSPARATLTNPYQRNVVPGSNS